MIATFKRLRSRTIPKDPERSRRIRPEAARGLAAAAGGKGSAWPSRSPAPTHFLPPFRPGGGGGRGSRRCCRLGRPGPAGAELRTRRAPRGRLRALEERRRRLLRAEGAFPLEFSWNDAFPPRSPERSLSAGKLPGTAPFRIFLWRVCLPSRHRVVCERARLCVRVRVCARVCVTLCVVTAESDARCLNTLRPVSRKRAAEPTDAVGRCLLRHGRMSRLGRGGAPHGAGRRPAAGPSGGEGQPLDPQPGGPRRRRCPGRVPPSP